MTLQRLSILGVGLLGGSIGLAMKSASSNCRIIGYAHREQTLRRALEMGAVDECTSDPTLAVRDCELVILCTPVGSFEQILANVAPSLAANAVVTDVGSTKRSVVRLAERILPSTVRFVGSHPMAGSEKRGAEAARADLYHGALCITTPTQSTDSNALSKVETFWHSLGMRTTRLSPDDHDRLLAEVSHLPHALAAALVAMQSDQALPLAGKGFLDTTRIAAGDGGLWRDIFLDNADYLRNALARLRQQIDRLDAMLDPKQSESLRSYLDQAARKRDAIAPGIREPVP